MPIKTIEQLREHLQTAIELEHSTIPPYLCAMYTIAPGTNQPSYEIIRSVVVEEMLHLTLAANVLNAVGGEPSIDSPRFVPEYPSYLPDGEKEFKVHLLKFSKEALNTFLKIERPARLEPRAGAAANLQAIRSQDKYYLGMGDRYYTIGEFYEEIEKGLRELVNQQGEKAVFTGNPTRQITRDYYWASGGEVIEVRDLHSAETALRVIVDQGEGLPNSIFDLDHLRFGQPREVAHYFRFQQIVLGRYYKTGDKPDRPTGGPLEVDWDAVYNMKRDPKTNEYPEDSQARARSADFNIGYTEFLRQLHSAFNGKRELLVPAVGNMFDIKYNAIELIKNPFPGKEGLNAGPAFEYAGDATLEPSPG